MEIAAGRTTVDELLGRARVGLDRLTPEEAWRAVAEGAVVVDTRSDDERRSQDALIPGALHYPLSVVVWRLDPECLTHNRKLPLDAHVIVVCREGYSSSLAAVWLRTIGFDRATDVIGGVVAWRAAGLPLLPYPQRERSRRL